MRVSFLLPHFPWRPIGGFRVVYEYASRLAMRGYEVTVIHSGQLRSSQLEGEGLPNAVWRVGKNLVNRFFQPKVGWHNINPSVRMRFINKLSERTIPESDVIVATAWQTAELVMSLPPTKGKKVYLIQSYEDWSGPRERVDATWRFPMKKVVIAKWLLRKGIELGVSPKEMFYVPNAIDTEKYRILVPISERKKHVSMAYSPLAVKGAVDGIRAITLAKELVPEMEATVFGTSTRPSLLPKWVTYRRNPSQTEIVSDIYNWASVFVSSSLIEGWSLPGAEAMACGCALSSTDSKGVREYAEHNVTALLSPPASPIGLSENIVRLLRDDHLRQRIAENGYMRIRSFSWDKSVEMFCQVITQ